jgi:HEAT repeat protein
MLEALEKERSNDILTGAMIALAKIGDVLDESGESQFVDVISGFLKDGNQEVAETAAIALGILADERSIETLVSLMKDDAAGRKAVGSTEVPVRTRAFAAYGLGLIGHETADNVSRQLVAEHLIDILESPKLSRRDVKVAAMTALGLVPLNWAADESIEVEEKSNAKHVASRVALLEYLIDYSLQSEMRANESTRHWFVIAHAPIAIARLLDRDAADAPSDLHAEYKTKIKDHLLAMVGKHSKMKDEVQQSATIGLGIIGDADGDDADKEIRSELLRLIKDGDQQSRRYALIAMGQAAGQPGSGDDPMAGSADIRANYMSQISRGKSGLRPWAALGLGVMGRALIDNQETANADATAALRTACAKEKAPSNVGAYCLGLGLRKDHEATDIILEKMNGFKGNQDTRGDAAIALGLMEQSTVIPDIQKIVEESKYKPELLKSASIALGLLGDKDVVPQLLTMLKESKGLATQAALSSALGQIGDARSLDPLIELLKDNQQTDLARGFAAVALGIICDKEDFPWNSKISTNINYRANTVTLTGDGGTGILDIL